MEAAETDPLAEGGEGVDPFDAVPADGGEAPPEEPPLVQQGELGGYNPSEEEGEDPLAEPDAAPADPLAEPDAGTPWNPGDEADTSADTPAPESAPEPPTEPDSADTEGDTPPDAEPEEPEAPAEEPKEEPKKPAAKKSQRKSAPKKDAPKKSERGYVVVKCDKDDNPIGIAGEVNARDDKAARRKVFDTMEDTEARLCAVPERYWNVKTLRAKERTVRDIEED
jgi:hypothetical protein